MRDVPLLVAVVVMHFYQGVVLHYISRTNVSHLGGNCILLVAHTHLRVFGVYSSYICLLPQGAVALMLL